MEQSLKRQLLKTYRNQSKAKFNNTFCSQNKKASR